MIFAALYRADLITGEIDQPTGRAVVAAGGNKADIQHLHSLATQAAHRSGAHGYRLYKGDTFSGAKAISHLHIVKGL